MLPQHCRFIPFDRKDARSGDREASSRFESLNGERVFRAHERLQGCELNEELPDKILVPACVRLHGYGRLQYADIRYPFPYSHFLSKRIFPRFITAARSAFAERGVLGSCSRG